MERKTVVGLPKGPPPPRGKQQPTPPRPRRLFARGRSGANGPPQREIIAPPAPIPKAVAAFLFVCNCWVGPQAKFLFSSHFSCKLCAACIAESLSFFQRRPSPKQSGNAPSFCGFEKSWFGATPVSSPKRGVGRREPMGPEKKENQGGDPAPQAKAEGAEPEQSRSLETLAAHIRISNGHPPAQPQGKKRAATAHGPPPRHSAIAGGKGTQVNGFTGGKAPAFFLRREPFPQELTPTPQKGRPVDILSPSLPAAPLRGKNAARKGKWQPPLARREKQRTNRPRASPAKRNEKHGSARNLLREFVFLKAFESPKA